jgi:hypothetical protein
MGNEFKYRYTPLAEVLLHQDPCVVAEAVRRYGCYELDSTEHLVKLDDAGVSKVLAMLGELNLINLRQLKERESCVTYEDYVELSQSPVDELCDFPECHPLLADFQAWRYGWPNGQLPDFKLPNKSDAPASACNGAPAKVGAGGNTASPATQVFRDMPNLTASELSIDFVAGDSGMVILEISAKKITKRVALAELDLLDRRKAEMNEQCGILLAMAQKRSVKTADQKTARRVSRLRAAIKTHLGIIDEPIATFRERVGYEPLFQVTDKRNAADERTKREAVRDMASLDDLSQRGFQVTGSAQDENSFDDEGDATAEWLRNNPSSTPD